MCTGGGGGNSKQTDYAAEQRALEAERQAKIAAEVEKINSAFGGFGDDYFNGVAGAYTDHYTPELTQQYNDARKRLIETNPGGGQGSAFNSSLANLDEEYAKQRANMADNASKFSSGYRNNVEGERSSLLNMASINGGSGASAAQAINQAKALATPPTYSPLGDLFQRVTGNLAAIQQVRGNNGAMYRQAPNLNFANSGRDNSVIVGGG